MTTAADNAYLAIRKMLAENELAPGSRVSQSKLARQLGCSPVPVLEAMRRLESDGLLTKKPRKMAKVRELSEHDIKGLYLVREGLEAVAARMCAQRITDEQAEELQQLNREFEAAVTAGDNKQSDHFEVAIHKYIVGVADCVLLAEELNRLLLIERTAGRTLSTAKPDLHKIAHRAIIQAVIDHDADSAEYLMKKHIQVE